MAQYSSTFYCPHCYRIYRKTRMLVLNEAERVWQCDIHKFYTKPAAHIGTRYTTPAPVEPEPRIGITSNPDAPITEGPRGPKGDKGDKGDRGDRGLPGPQGPSGLESGGKIYVQPERPANLTTDDVWFEI